MSDLTILNDPNQGEHNQEVINGDGIVRLHYFLMNSGDENAVLEIADADGLKTPPSGFIRAVGADSSGMANMNKDCRPPVVIDLTGSGADLYLSYEVVTWEELMRLWRSSHR